MEPILHECFHQYEYDTSQLPLVPGERFERMQMRYWFDFTSLVDLTPEGRMMVTAAIGFEWRDEHREWNTSEVPVDHINVHADEVWHPWFFLANCESADCIIKPQNQTRVRIRYTGISRYQVFSRMITSSCDLDLTLFPFDQQTCDMNFILGDYTTSHIAISGLNITTLRQTYDNDEWDLIHMFDGAANFSGLRFKRNPDGSWNMNPYEKTFLGYSGFIVKLTFQRRHDYYIYNLLVPVLLISLMGCFTIFLSPKNSGDRLNLVVTVLLGFLFLQSTIASVIPQAVNTPNCAKYVLGALALSGMNLAFSTIVVWVHNLPPTKKPNRLILLICIHFLSYILNPLKLFHRSHKNSLNDTNHSTDPNCTCKDDESQIYENISSLLRPLRMKNAQVKVPELRMAIKNLTDSYLNSAADGEFIKRMGTSFTSSCDDPLPKIEHSPAKLNSDYSELWIKIAYNLNSLFSFVYIGISILLFVHFLLPLFI